MIQPDIIGTFWEACSETQRAWWTNEKCDPIQDGKKRSLFTLWFCDILRLTNGDISRRDLYSRVQQKVLSEAAKCDNIQDPQLETTYDDLLDKRPFT